MRVCLRILCNVDASIAIQQWSLGNDLSCSSNQRLHCSHLWLLISIFVRHHAVAPLLIIMSCSLFNSEDIKIAFQVLELGTSRWWLVTFDEWIELPLFSTKSIRSDVVLIDANYHHSIMEELSYESTDPHPLAIVESVSILCTCSSILSIVLMEYLSQHLRQCTLTWCMHTII